MQNFVELVLQNSITFFAILDPIGCSAIMLSLLSNEATKEEVTKIATKTTITIIVAFFTVLFVGNSILSLFGINQSSIKVIGGIILIITSLQMLQSSENPKKLSKEENEEAKQDNNISIIPIAIPITFGPGIFSTIIILKEHSIGYMGLIAMSIAFLLNALVLYLVFKNSIYLKKYLGVTGQNLITKLMGLIVGAIAVQFIVSGVVALSLMYLK